MSEQKEAKTGDQAGQPQEKGNASERINLQHIMELREAFDLADTDKGGALELDEFIEAFGEIIGKNMTHKQLNQLFMKIDADSNGSVDWPEFMNYMLLENETLSSMKRETFEYVRVGQQKNLVDPEKQFFNKCHASMITAILVIEPDHLKEKMKDKDNQQQGNIELLKRKIRYATASRDGYVKIWNAYTLQMELWVKVTNGSWVTCLAYMEHSKKLACGSANRMITFYKIDSSHQGGTLQVDSRIEDLVAIPMCLEYYHWKDNENKNDDKIETLLCGDGLGICHKWDFSADWHICQYKEASNDPPGCQNCIADIKKKFKEDMDKQYEQMEKNKKLEKKRLKNKMENVGDDDELKKDDDDNESQAKKSLAKPEINKRQKRKIIKYQKIFDNVKYIEKVIHRSWVTKIKYYDDLKYVVSSSVDSLIHIHDIDDLNYKDEKTFNIHQKPVNSFIYSQKSRFIASCGEERHILMWDPFTLGVLTYLYGHNTSVQDLALNEDRYHLISLGTDKCIIIWDIKKYLRIQTIFDKVPYRPEDRLTALAFDQYTNHILLGSRKINQWFFRTQEEIRTSHEFPVAFALNNSEFESVVSGDDGGFIAVWDIEDGRILSRFGDAHVSTHDDANIYKKKITTGCLDSSQRRLITAGEDGTCKIWNFSNGQKLTQLISKDAGYIYKNPEQVFPTKQVKKKEENQEEPKKKMRGLDRLEWTKKAESRVFKDINKAATGEKKDDAEEKIRDFRVDKNEITKIVCMFDPKSVGQVDDDEQAVGKDYIVGVGWGKQVHIWSDDKEDEVQTSKTLPQNKQKGHMADIMSVCCYWGNSKNNIQMIYTGGHDGSLISWSLETGSAKRYLHDKDSTCLAENKDPPAWLDPENSQNKNSNNAIWERKSVDALLILERHDKLLSMTADQWLRFWSLDELKTEDQPTFKKYCDHAKDDQLTCCAVTEDNETLVTADTNGCLKIWNIKNVNFDDQSTEDQFIEKAFIIAHYRSIDEKKAITTVQIVENIKSGKFILTACQDNNIRLHNLENGIIIGQFGRPEDPNSSDKKCWDIHNIEYYNRTRKPRYVREWYDKLKQIFNRKNPKKPQKQEDELTQITDGSPIQKANGVAAKTGNLNDLADKKILDDEQIVSGDEEKQIDAQYQYYEDLVDNMEFSEDEEEDPHLIKNAAQYMQPYKKEKKNSKRNEVNMNDYFDFFQNKYPPDIARYSKKHNFKEPAIRMTGKNQILKGQDDNEEDEWPPIIGPIYDLKMEQHKAKLIRQKNYKTGHNEFPLE